MHYLLILVAYLIGSIPFGLLFGKLSGIDIRAGGSGNIGATNASRLLGKKMGLVTLLADAGKAVLPMLLTAWLLRHTHDRDLWVAMAGAAAFLGHIFPVYLKFQGGKGVATALGIFLYLDPLAVLIDVAIFLATVYNWGYVSLGSLTAATMLPGLIWITSGSPTKTILALFIAALIWLKHRSNIGRLLRHEEKSWKQSGNKEE